MPTKILNHELFRSQITSYSVEGEDWRGKWKRSKQLNLAVTLVFSVFFFLCETSIFEFFYIEYA